MNDLTAAILAIVGGAFTLAIVSVVLSQRAQTASVIGASGTALSNVIAAAVNPITMNNPTSLGSNTFSTANINSAVSALQAVGTAYA